VQGGQWIEKLPFVSFKILCRQLDQCTTTKAFSERVPAFLCRPSPSFPPSHHSMISSGPDGMPSLPAIQSHVLITALRVAEIDPSCSPFALTSPPPTGCDQSHTIQILASKWRQCRMGGHSLFDGKGASNPYLGLRHPLHPAHSQKPPPSIHRGCPGRAQNRVGHWSTEVT
jgi:hypothetical protein